ncbi:hypothetical protein EW026_g5898 [Hermanssonia centrifuga]|uniref:Uncharacterized protein n=1 Tax=Hermanssonia centrifuga TaxID=98765 RepID=A0A4S4KCN7_9APHY|nr:hypothetical protein EW026_g5898 [Hermanssonia centrifuga]
MTSRYKDEVQRAELAESRAKEVILRFKEANDARLAAQQESMRMREELALYKLQLENAQQEIMKGQQMLDAVEAQRHEAEEAAARARTTARKFKEERLMQQAKEEGRMEGVKEGFARGRVLGYEEARATGFTRFIPTDIEDFKQSAVVSPEAQPVVSSGPETSKSSPTNAPSLPLEPDPNIRIYSPAGTQTPPTVVATPARSFRNPASPLIPVHNVSGSPQHMLANYLPEGWIPTIDGDRIRLPPPHELSPAPPTPSTTPKLSPRSHPRVTVEDVPEEPILMIPPPFISERNTADSDSDTVSVRSTAKRPRNRRRKSIDSQSTTVSQFDILGPPIASSARGNAAARSNVLSAIVEDSERERSPSMSSMMYAPMMTPNAVSPMVMPTLRAPVASVPGPDLSQLGQQEQYKRSESRASAPRDGPSRNESRQSTGRRASDASSIHIVLY